jgi:hypothetical protein
MSEIWTDAAELKELFFGDFDKSVESKINEICAKIIDGKFGLVVPYKKDSAYIEMFAKQLLKDDPKIKEDYFINTRNFYKLTDKFELENGEDVADEIWDKYEIYNK